MDNRVGNSNGSGIAKRQRSLDLKTIYGSGYYCESEKKWRKRQNGDGGDVGAEGSVSKSCRKEVSLGSARNQVRNSSSSPPAEENSAEVSSIRVVYKASGLESVRDAERDKLASLPLDFRGAFISIPKRKRSPRCGGSQEPKADVNNLNQTVKLDTDTIGTQTNILKGYSKVRECENVQLKSGWKLKEEDGGTDSKGNVGGMEAHAESLLGCKKKGLDKSKRSKNKQMKSSQKVDRGENTDCTGDAPQTSPDSLNVYEKILSKGSGSGNRHLKPRQKENEEEGKPDCLGNGICLGPKKTSLKVHRKKGLDKVGENRNRQMKSSQKVNEDGKVDCLENGDCSKAWTNSVKVHKKKGLHEDKECRNEKLKPNRSRDEKAGRTKCVVAGDCSGNQSDSLQIHRKKTSHKGKEIENLQLQLNFSQNAAEESGRADCSGVSNAESTLKKAARKLGKAKGLSLDKKSVENKVGSMDDDNCIETFNDIDEDDEENLEENAARMLSSRFDPSCTGFSSCSKPTCSLSKDRFSLLSSDREFNQGSRFPRESESASADAASIVLRPRSQDIKGSKRKRRHYYEISFGNVDPFWIVNQCIKVYWPLDDIWYSGLVDKYDLERKLHHVKYVDRDEEWINLRNEKFKLLLLPSEAPGKTERRRAVVEDRIGDKIKENVKTLKENGTEKSRKGGDSHGSSFGDSEPIISWLARTFHRTKKLSCHATKKQKTNDLTPLSDEARGVTLDRDISKMSSVERLDDLGKVKKCILDYKNVSKDGNVPIVYFRRRFRKTSEVLYNAYEGSSSSGVAFEHNTSLSSVTKLGSVEESAKNVGRSDLSETFWPPIGDAGTVKLTMTLLGSVVCISDVRLSELLVYGYAFATENCRLFYALMLCKYGTVMKVSMWPRVYLEMLFVDNTRGLSLFLFQSCLEKALTVIHPVLTVFDQPSEGFDLGLPITSIRFKITCVQDHRKQIVFTLYSFSEVSLKKWTCLEYKLRRHCLDYDQLPLSECTFDNIKTLQNAEQGCSSAGLRMLTGQGGSEQFVMKIADSKVGLLIGEGGETIKNMQAQSGARIQVITSRKLLGDTSTERTLQVDGTSDQIEAALKLINEVVSEGLWRRSRRGLHLMGASRGCSSVSVGSNSCLTEIHKKLPLFAISFSAAPTFFRGLHYKLLMDHSIPFHHFQDHDSMEYQENIGMVNLYSRMLNCDSKASDTATTAFNLDTMSTDFRHSNSLSLSGPELDTSALKSSYLLAAAELKNAKTSVCSQGPDKHVLSVMSTEGRKCSDVSHDDLVTYSQVELEAAGSAVCGARSPVKSSHFLNKDDQATPDASVRSQNPVQSGTGDKVLTESKRCSQVELNNSIVPSRPSPDEDKSLTGPSSYYNNVSIEIPAPSQLGSSATGELHSVGKFTDYSRDISVGAISSPNPTAPRSSSLHRNRSSSSCQYSSHGWSESKADILPYGFGNRHKKPRTQVSYALPFGDIDFGSRSRSHLHKGLLPKRIRRSNERRSSDIAAGSDRNLEFLSCESNVLITDGDRGRRVCGALVVLELFDHNEWKLAVKVSGVTRYSYKAHQFLQPGSTSRYTHAMMWKGGKDWTLEFPDRSQWALFKEMHEECYSRNIRAAMVKNIPIPGVRLLDENDVKGGKVPFVRDSLKYFRQEKTDVEMALDKCRILYDMDSDDEQWLKEQNSSARDSSTLGEISEELFEKIMDMFEKLAYSKQRDQFPFEDIQGSMSGMGPIEIVTAIYNYWQLKRQKKGMPLIRHLQPALWERYQQQLREWEQAVIKSNYTFRNGHQEKSAPIEKPAMFAFCLKPRGLDVPNKCSKHRSQKKISVSAHGNIIQGEQDGCHAFGRKSVGFTPSEEKMTHQGQYFESISDSPRSFSPRETRNGRYFSTVDDGFDVVDLQNLNRSRTKNSGTLSSPKSPHRKIPYGQRIIGMKSRTPSQKMSFSEWAYQQHYQPEGSQKYCVKMVDDSEFEELRRREAARHASSMARLKRERAQRLLNRADLLVHKAAVAMMTAEAIKTASESSSGDR